MSDRDAIRALLTSLLRARGDSNSFSEEESLLTTGRLDSLNALAIITYLEEKYGTDFATQPMEPAMLGSVAGILKIIEAHSEVGSKKKKS